MKIEKVFKNIAKLSKKTSQDVYVVGGYVRDELLGKEIKKDIDFVVNGSGLAFAQAFDREMKGVGRLVEFPNFDTARYLFFDKEEHIILETEFAGARKEQYKKGSRKPKVETTTIQEDLSRRDFTVNAMTQKIGTRGLLGEVIDLFDGQSDLQKKILRTPLDPDETFSDDPLRMLRAARFAAQLDFEIEEETLTAMKKNAKRLKIVSRERILEEFLKLLSSQRPSTGLWILQETGLMDEFLPEIGKLAGVEEIFGHGHKDNLWHTFAVVDNIAEYSENAMLRFAGFMHDIGKADTKKYSKGRGWTFDMHEHLGRKMVRQIGKRLKMSKDDTEYVAQLVRWHLQPIALMDDGVTDSPVRRLIVDLQENLDDLLILCRADVTTGNPKKKAKRLNNYDFLEKRIEEVLEKDKLRAFQSPVRGEEIMELCGLKPGPTVGKIKTAIEDAILDGEIPNEYENAFAYFQKIKGEYMKDAEEWEKKT
ncbi:MAG: HD domain-containing protein [Candidatus Magasanikbacteria bacterium]